jgi:hypothetical protein
MSQSARLIEFSQQTKLDVSTKKILVGTRGTIVSQDPTRIFLWIHFQEQAFTFDFFPSFNNVILPIRYQSDPNNTTEWRYHIDKEFLLTQATWDLAANTTDIDVDVIEVLWRGP